MNIDLRAELRAVSPLMIQERLRSRGWLQHDADRHVVVYRRGTDELDVPLRADLADYTRRVEELIGLLAALEGIGPAELLETLLEPVGDAVALRIASPITATGTIPLDDALRIRQGLKNVVLASAHSALAPQPWFPRMTQRLPMELLASVREGQSQRGSYTMRCIVPVSAPVGEFDLEEPYGRKVTRTLVTALQAVQDVRSRGDREGLLALHDRGVSGNLLAALATMAPPSGVGALEVSVAWAKNRPAPPLDAPNIRFSAESFDGLKEAALAMRDRVRTRGFEVTGYVTRLDQGVDQQGNGGDVVIAPSEGDALELGRVTVRLAETDYQSAIEAHRASARIRVLGTLGKSGRRWMLSEPTGFERCVDVIDD